MYPKTAGLMGAPPVDGQKTSGVLSHLGMESIRIWTRSQITLDTMFKVEKMAPKG